MIKLYKAPIDRKDASRAGKMWSCKLRKDAVVGAAGNRRDRIQLIEWPVQNVFKLILLVIPS
jgi:hypothetical protein